jgi:hypothetical protein
MSVTLATQKAEIRNQEDGDSKPTLSNYFMRPYLKKKPITKKR